MDYEAHIASLEASRKTLTARVRLLEKWYDTINTPIWKRAWFVIQGYHFFRLGVWYKAPWNKDGQVY